jgi:lysophospholipase L1-like esterase
MRNFYTFLALSALPFFAQAQRMPVDEFSTSVIISPIGGAFNRIFNDYGLDSFYNKLGALHKKKKGTVRIVHIGDSHIQAGFFPAQVRKSLQDFFGNAGRGLVFPYDGIQTNAPPDLQSVISGPWVMDKVASTGDAGHAGVSGFGLRTNAPGAEIQINTQENFSRIRVFTDREPEAGWIIRTGDMSRMVRGSKQTPYADIELDAPSQQVLLSTMPSEKRHGFYGISLENGQPGVIYHAIGVNGARFDQYNRARTFWDQLPGLQADLYIISLGTNDAQRNRFDGKEFNKMLDEFVKHLRKASPGIPVIFTTAPDSYRNGRSNQVLRDMNLALFEYCTSHNIAAWDLYRVTNGYGSAASWLRKGLMNEDRVHFTPEGYQLQGQLLLNALAKSYNDYHGY